MAKCILYVDGASRGNPGAASIGVSMQNAEGEEIATISLAIGRATNNEAEYRALIESLRLAKQRDFSEIMVRADSELVVRQMKGEYRVKKPALKILWQEAKELAKNFHTFSISHVRREQNSRADELANQALDG